MIRLVTERYGAVVRRSVGFLWRLWLRPYDILDAQRYLAGSHEAKEEQHRLLGQHHQYHRVCHHHVPGSDWVHLLNCAKCLQLRLLPVGTADNLQVLPGEF